MQFDLFTSHSLQLKSHFIHISPSFKKPGSHYSLHLFSYNSSYVFTPNTNSNLQLKQ